MVAKIVFLSTPSGWRATVLSRGRLSACRISIHALRREGDQNERRAQNEKRISIHALRMEGDHLPAKRQTGPEAISIHALRMEGDPQKIAVDKSGINFYPRPPDGGRLDYQDTDARWKRFLSTPSGWRATSSCTPAHSQRPYFYPRPPDGGRRDRVAAQMSKSGISIHALRMEGDKQTEMQR